MDDATREELQAYLESRGFAVYAHEDTEDLRTAANLDRNLLKGLNVCSACQDTGMMDGAVCAHCEDEDDADEAHAEDAWEARQAAMEEDEDIARDKKRWPEEADFE